MCILQTEVDTYKLLNVIFSKVHEIYDLAVKGFIFIKMLLYLLHKQAYKIQCTIFIIYWTSKNSSDAIRLFFRFDRGNVIYEMIEI